MDGSMLTEPSEIKFSSAAVIEKNGLRSNNSISNAPKGSIAVINLQGPLMKHDQECGPAGTASVASWIRQADMNPNIEGIILDVDSPGGTVDGTEELARTIASTKKPIVGYVNGLAASAAYWAISQCDEIIAGGKTSEVGSIGTMASWADMKPVFEKAGIKFHEVYASKSSDKNKVFRDAASGEYEGLIAELDQLNDVFHASVQKARPQVKEKTLTGAVYLSTEAKKLGLVDSIGTMDDAIKAIQRLKSTRNMSKNNTAEQYPAFTSLLGFTEGFEATEEGVHLSMESIDTLEAALSASATAADDLTAANAALNAFPHRIAELEADLATATQTIARHEATIATLKDQPAGSGTRPIGTPDPSSTFNKPKSNYVDDGSQALLDQLPPARA